MNKESHEALVTEAINLDREVREKIEKLKDIKADLVAIAKHQPESDRTLTDGGGWSLIFDGGSSGVARITMPGPKLKSSIDFGSKKGEALLAKIGEKESEALFDIQLKNVPVADFRDRVTAMYTPAKAASIIRAMTTESAATVSFETKEAA